ncbi:AzlD domain-containing protein [Pseudodesulfovibrio sediminis]|nr:AzlD domain-containing protein [Pseudodesulfovibrio sediminis]
MQMYWPVVLCLAGGTFLMRFSFILIMDKLTLPEALLRMLRFIPVAVLPALVAPAFVLHHEAGVTTFGGWERAIAGVVAVGVAYKTKNIFATIIVGMTVMWVLKALL